MQRKITNLFMLFVLAVSLVPSFLPAQDVQAQGLTEVEIQPDGNSGYDGYISSTNATTNYATSTTMLIGETSGDEIGRGLITWDFSTLPSDADIETAILSLWVSEDLAANAGNLQVFPVNQVWVEAEATWNRYSIISGNDQNWQTAGASGVDDIVDTVVGETALAADLAVDTRIDITLDPALMGDVLRGNYIGFLLKTELQTNDAYKFYTSDAVDGTKRPMLTLEYDPSPIITDPGWLCVDGTVTCEPYLNDYDVYSPFYHYAAEENVPTNYGEAYDYEGVQIAMGAKINCEPYPRCRNDYPIYYTVLYTYEWTSYYQFSVYANTTLRVSGGGVVDHQAIYCLQPTVETNHGICKGILRGVILPEEIPNSPHAPDGGMDIFLRTNISFATGFPVSAGIVWDFFLSRQMPEPTCSDTYAVPVIDTYTIDPTLELPEGMANGETPVDEQGYTLEVGSIYMLRVQDGPWSGNDDTGDRYDTAISFDGTTYTPLDDFIVGSTDENLLCYDIDPLNPYYITIYFMATTEAVYIRANDSDEHTPSWFINNTNDAETPLSYSIGIAYGLDVQSCEEQFTYDEAEDLVANVIVLAYVGPIGDIATDDLQTGEWYAVEVTGGAWVDPPPTTESQDLEYMFGHINQWNNLAEGSPQVQCAISTENGSIVFLQASGDVMRMRVDDQEDNWADNVGAVNVSIYHATFQRIQDTCELNFALDDIISTDYIDAEQENGKQIATAVTGRTEESSTFNLSPGAWYALETYGGPWGYYGDTYEPNSGFGLDYDLDIAVSLVAWDPTIILDGSPTRDWVPLSEWSGADCNIQTDNLGHRLVYFRAPLLDYSVYHLRVSDISSWRNNDEGMYYNLYRVIDLGPDDSGICDYSYNEEDKLNTEPLTVRADYSNGAYIQTGSGPLQVNTYYAIKLLTSEYHWYEETGGDPQTEMELSLNNGTSWADLPNGTLCAIDGDDYVFFLRTGTSESLFKLRANSETFENNTELMAYDIYTAEAGSSINPYDGCVSEGYTTSSFYYQWIPVREEAGIGVNGTNPNVSNPQLTPGESYILETSRGPWVDDDQDGTEHYDAEVSSDGGVTWYPMNGTNPNVTCWEMSTDTKYFKIEFTVEAGQVWRIRVADTGTDTFSDNSGNLAYSVKQLIIQSDDPITGIISLAGCTTEPVLPQFYVGQLPSLPGIEDILELPGVLVEGFLAIMTGVANYLAEWFDYSIAQIRMFFLWCPENTETVTMFGQSIIEKDPFAFFNEFEGVLYEIQNEINGYEWEADGEDYSILTKTPAQSKAMIEQHIFGPLPEDSPWRGGNLVEFNNGNFDTSYYENCDTSLGEYVGPLLGKGVCWASNLARELGYMFYIQLLLDVSIIFAALHSIVNNVKRLIYLFTGVNLSIMKTDVRVAVNAINEQVKK